MSKSQRVVNDRLLSRTETERLSAAQSAALAARCAMRAIPLFRPSTKRSTTRRRHDILTIDACVMQAASVAVGCVRADTRRILSLAEAAADASRAASASPAKDDHAFAAAAPAIYAAYATAAGASEDGAAILADATACAANTATHAACNSAALRIRSANRWDFDALTNGEIARSRRTVPRTYFNRPLWPTDATQALTDWNTIVQSWIALLAELSLARVAEWLQDIANHQHVDWVAAAERAEAWGEATPVRVAPPVIVPAPDTTLAVEVDRENAIEDDRRGEPGIEGTRERRSEESGGRETMVPAGGAPVVDVIDAIDDERTERTRRCVERVAPIGPTEKNEPLANDALVTALADLILTSRASEPLSVGLFGESGAGKTAVMTRLQDRLTKRAPDLFDFAWFDTTGGDAGGRCDAQTISEVDERRVVSRVKHEFEQLCGPSRAGGSASERRLTVFVDDLNRCGPTYVAAVLEAIRHAMDIERVVIVLAVDAQVAMAALGERYHAHETDRRPRSMIAREILGGIVHVPVRLDRSDPWRIPGSVRLRRRIHAPCPAPTEAVPERSEDDVHRVAATIELDNHNDLHRFHELASAFEFHNPRCLTRLIRSYRLLKSLRDAQRYPMSATDERLRWMVFWQEFILRRPPDMRDRCRASLECAAELDGLPDAVSRVVASIRERMCEAFKLLTVRPRAFEATATLAERFTLPGVEGPSEANPWPDQTHTNEPTTASDEPASSHRDPVTNATAEREAPAPDEPDPLAELLSQTQTVDPPASMADALTR